MNYIPKAEERKQIQLDMLQRADPIAFNRMQCEQIKKP